MAKKTLPPEIPAARWLPLRDLRPNPENPRVIRDDAFAKLVESLRSFPQMLRLRPLVVASWADHVILGGNMRYRAAQAAGVDPVPVLAAEDLTPEQRREFVIKDNVIGGEWDWDALANSWSAEELIAWGLELPTVAQEEPEPAHGGGEEFLRLHYGQEEPAAVRELVENLLLERLPTAYLK